MGGPGSRRAGRPRDPGSGVGPVTRAVAGGRRRACRRWRWPRGWPSPSSTAASSDRPSPSRRWSTPTGEAGSDIVATRADPERTARLAALAVRSAKLAPDPGRRRRVAIVLSAYPTKRARLGNAVGLDTPASAIELLGAMAGAGYRVDRIPASGDALMDELAAGFTYEHAAAERGRNWNGPPAAFTRRPMATGSPACRRRPVARWSGCGGRRPARCTSTATRCTSRAWTLATCWSPSSRREGSAPIRSPPTTPPTCHPRTTTSLSTGGWQPPGPTGGWGADAVVHLGKHGTLEWLPGKALALSAACYPDAAIADLPFFYPFVVNDPGEGTQAKRRAHAVVVDHLPPPLTRADTYDDLARLEQLLDAYASVSAMDPAKAPALRDQVWELLVGAEIHRDLDLGDTVPGDDELAGVLLPRRRLPVCPQGRPDPGRSPRARPHARWRRPDRHRAGRHPASPGVCPLAAGHGGGRARHRPPRRRPPRRRPGRGRVPVARSRPWPPPAGMRRRQPTPPCAGWPNDWCRI